MSTYVLDNRHTAAAAHHTALALLFNSLSIMTVEGLVDLPGKRVLDVGAGHGSMSRLLADEVGPGGQVVAVDIAPQVTPHPRVEVVRHDLTRVGGWPPQVDGPFDLVYTRMTLQHLPNRELVLAELVDRLAPGGWLLVQDLAGRDRDMVAAAPTPGAADLYERYQRVKTAIFDTGGTDRRWPARMHQRFLAHGLHDVHTTIHSSYWTAGSPGLALERAVLEQVAGRLMEYGMTSAELDAVRGLLGDPLLIVHGHPLYSTAGQAKPATRGHS